MHNYLGYYGPFEDYSTYVQAVHTYVFILLFYVCINTD